MYTVLVTIIPWNGLPQRGNNAVTKTTHKHCVDGRKKRTNNRRKMRGEKREGEKWSNTDDKKNDSILHNVIALVCSKQAVQLLTTMYLVRIINDCVLNFYVFSSLMPLMPVINAWRCLMWKDVHLKQLNQHIDNLLNFSSFVYLILLLLLLCLIPFSNVCVCS